MDHDLDDDDLRSLSERVLPLTSTSYTNNTSPRNSNRIRTIKPQKSLSSDYEILTEEESFLPTTASTGDIIQLTDGTRKKYNGSSWRRMCSKTNCSYYTQSGGLCKPHLAAFKKRQSSDEISLTDPVLLEHEISKKGDIITLENGIRKKYDGRQFRRICADPTCAIVVHGSLEYQNGLCPHHYQEFRTKNLSQSTSSPETSPVPSVVSSTPSRKRRRQKSPSPINRSQSPVFDIQSSVPNYHLSVATISPSTNIKYPQKGDIIDMENGSRKKFDGVVWRKICSLPDCFIAAQRNELCRKHFIKLNGKPNNGLTSDFIGTVSMVTSVSKSVSSMSTSSVDEKSDFQNSKKIKDESIDYDDIQEEPNIDNTSNSYNGSDDEVHNGHYEDNLGTEIDHTLIDALSTSRQKFLTNHLKKWLREHRTHPYPSNQEKSELAKQSFITYDQVTTWFNNARAILRRRQAKLRDSLDNNEELLHENKKSAKVHRSLPLFNGVCCRSVGVQCNPSTVNQTTSTSVMTDEELTVDRTIKILTPSSHILKTNSIQRSGSQEFLLNGINTEEDDEYRKSEEIIITSTCLDDDQMVRLKEFSSRFHIKLSDNVDKHTTHLITDEEEGATLVCPLSKKVIQAVAHHMYIITYRWIDVCLQLNQLTNEKSYEIQGDLTLSSDHNGMQRSRQSILPDNLPKTLLLENFAIMLKCDGCQEMLNNDELIELVQLSGAKYTTDSHFSRLQTGIKRVVLCEKEYLINRKQMYEKCHQAGVHFLTPEWFLESLVQYRIQPFQEYQITP